MDGDDTPAAPSSHDPSRATGHIGKAFDVSEISASWTLAHDHWQVDRHRAGREIP